MRVQGYPYTFEYPVEYNLLPGIRSIRLANEKLFCGDVNIISAVNISLSLVDFFKLRHLELVACH